MKRRTFITGLGSAAAWPLAARAQQGGVRIPRIGIIDEWGPTLSARTWNHFRQGLHDLGYIEGRNIAIEFRSAEGFDQVRQAARELASLPVNILVVYGSLATRAARQTTSTIPIVMMAVGDPVRARFVTSLARPGGNVTGSTNLTPELIGKRFEILKECVPDLARVAFLWNPDNDSNVVFLEELIIAVPALGLQLISVPMRTSHDFRARICRNDAETAKRICHDRR